MNQRVIRTRNRNLKKRKKKKTEETGDYLGDGSEMFATGLAVGQLLKRCGQP
jgi:hypothetical protein